MFKRLTIAALIFPAFAMPMRMADASVGAAPAGQVLFFNPETKVIFASADPQDAAIQSVTVSQVAALVADGATVDASAQTFIDENQAPEVATRRETTGTQATLGENGSNVTAADANTTSTTDATGSAASALGTTGTDAPAVALPGEDAPAADASGGTVASAASEGDAGNTAAAATSTADSASTGDAGNAGASDAAGTSGSVSGATALDASSSAGTAGDGTDTAGTIAGRVDTAAVVTIELGGTQVASYTAATVEDAVQQAVAAYPSSAHPVHEIFALIEVELSQPTGLIKNEIKNLLNRGRAMF